jgi:malate dehydrogenase (quinone)
MSITLKHVLKFTGKSTFKQMVFSTDFNQLKEWMPLVMEGRSETDRVAATSMTIGTDVNFGELTRNIFTYLANLEGVTMHFNCEFKN